MFGFLGSVYAGEASQAFAILKLCHHASQSAAFAYAGYLDLYWQLGILCVSGATALAGFTSVDIMVTRAKES